MDRSRRRARSLATKLTTILLLGASILVTPTAPLQAGPPAARIRVRDGVTQPVFSYKKAIRQTVYVQSSVDQDRDGDLDLLATDIIRPRATRRGLDVPVIYEMSPYYQTLGRGNESETKEEEDGDFVPERFPLFYDNYFVPRGYAVVNQDMRGTRNSEGCMVLGGRLEALDARATIRWLNGKGKAFDADGDPVRARWSSGRVGMIGKSYDGSVANGTAALGVKGLKTIVPIGGISRWYDYHLNRGVQYANAYLTPGLFAFAIDQQPGDDEERKLEWIEATFGENTTCTARGLEIVAKAADPRANYTRFWRRRDYLKDVEKVRASVFVVHGLNDWNVKPNHYVQWWNGLRDNGVARKIWLTQTGHVDPFDFRRKKWVRTLHRWFDRWLHGIRNGIMKEPVADVERRANRWRRYDSWPARRARPVRMWLGPRAPKRPGTLGLRRAPRGSSQSYSDDPDQGEREMSTNRHDDKPHRLLFTTRKLRRPVRLSGSIQVRIRARVDRPDTNFTGLLMDYGRARRVFHESSGDGIRTVDKQSCYGGRTAADDGCYHVTRKVTHVSKREIVSRGWLDARHRRSLRRGTPLEPGEVYTFRWRIFGEDYVFQRGHRIGIVIAGSDADFTVPDPERARVTVLLRGSRATLPVVGGARRLSFRAR